MKKIAKFIALTAMIATSCALNGEVLPTPQTTGGMPLMQAMQGAAEELYSKAGPQGAAGAGPQPGPQPGAAGGSSKKGDDGVVDADFEEVK